MLPLLLSAAACLTEMVPDPEPATSDELIEALPDEPAPAPAPMSQVPEGAGRADVSMIQIRGTPPGTEVRVDGFYVETDDDGVVISADSEGATLKLRCLDAAAPDGIDRLEAVVVEGATADPKSEVIALSDCAIAPKEP
ncbi:MAG: hypothetical protein R3F59_20755 [Myxococcota bacterium]